MGFQNFLLLIILLFLTLSFWLRRRESLGAGGAAALAG